MIKSKILYLASRSRARQKILKNLGIRFKVIPSRVQEHLEVDASPVKTVEANALLKARDVASRVTAGVILACDTMVEQGGKIFGKPRDLKDARRMLKALSSKPHRIFTGIALIDVKRGKEFVGCEETKIAMEKLSDREISRYFKKITPLDKAGGFDIQGLGGLFIKRIEGCYFNVVGLPVSKMYVLFKKAGIPLLVLCLSLTLFGCATEYNVATNRQDWMMYSTEREASIGDSLSREIEKNYPLIQDIELNDRVRRVGERIAAVSDRTDVLYRFRVIEDKEDPKALNAVSLPGGYVYVFKELFREAETDDELAGVLGHEVAHIVARHSMKRLQAIWGYNILSVLAAATGSPDAAVGARAGYLQLMAGYSREDELLADQLGARYAKLAGYDPKAMIVFLEKLRQHDKKEKSRPISYFRTHPYTGERVRAAREETGEKMTFDDFINTQS